MLDESGATILDMLCKPAHPIEDYLTRFSGITAELLKDVDATLSDVQTKLKEIIPANAVLVGHSLVRALTSYLFLLSFVFCIDTSMPLPPPTPFFFSVWLFKIYTLIYILIWALVWLWLHFRN